ncbi:MAG: HAD-IA family hydrolase [Chloroflexi bacterium]|nr:HAD-IA family hydrolase [Chloroflexota bacterium]
MSSLPRPEVVFLDLGDTLIRAHPSWPAVYLSAFPRFGIQASEAELAEAIRRATSDGYWAFEGPFDATEEGSFKRMVDLDRRVLAELGHQDLPDELFRAIEDAFQQRSAWHIFPDVIPALDRLRQEGVRLAVISNWVWGAPELLHDLELAGHFESLIVSARMGYQKPHRAIFDHAIDLMSVAPERAIHVGDSYRADVLGARAAGITPILIDRRLHDPERFASDVPGDDPVTIIGDLGGLLDLMGVAAQAGASRQAS